MAGWNHPDWASVWPTMPWCRYPLLIAESRPEEKVTIVKVIVSLITGRTEDISECENV